MINFDAYKTDGPKTILSPLKLQRDWMQDNEYSYNCFPLSLANKLGWGISFPEDISFVWNDSNNESGIEILSGEEYCYFDRGESVICFPTDLVFKTNSDLSILTMPVPNQIIDGVQCLTSVISSSFYTAGFQVIWKVLTKNKVITIKAGTPVAAIIPISLSVLNDSSITVHDKTIPDQKHNQDYMKKMKEYSIIKDRFTGWYKNATDQYGNIIGEHETKSIKLYVIEEKKKDD